MSGETEESVSGWTTDTLKAHIDKVLSDKDLRDTQRFNAHEQVHIHERREMDAAFAAAQEKAASHNDLIAANERSMALTMPRGEYDRAHQALVERVDAGDQKNDEAITALTLRVAVNEAAVKASRELITRMFAVVAAIGVVVGIVGVVIIASKG
jgi:hypothetical protein